MPSIVGYLEDWRDVVQDGIRSYADAVAGLRRERNYHRERSMESPDDRDAAEHVLRIEIPLLWGTF